MTLLPSLSLRRTLVALGAFAALATLLAAPAAADRGRHWHSRGPRVGVYVGVPPIVLVAGRPAPYYDYDPYRYERRERAYESGYADGYDDGWDDRAREEWRRRHRHGHHHRHHDCDD